MNRWITTTTLTLALIAPGAALAVTREIADLQPARLTFDRSVINQLTDGTYRDPFDELQTRPYNLLFNNIGRHPNLSPWPGQEGNYTRFLNALIGNNGAANVDNAADSLQGSLVRRETDSWAWGTSLSVLKGEETERTSNAAETTLDGDGLSGFDIRPGFSLQLSERRVLGGGLRFTDVKDEFADNAFEPGVGGSQTSDDFKQRTLLADVGLRSFLGSRSSWEAQVLAGYSGFEQDEFTLALDDTGAVTDRLTSKNYDISELSIGIYGGYNRLRQDRLGETSYRLGIERSSRELDNSDLSFSQTGAVITPITTLLDQDPLTWTGLRASARTVFHAGETEMFAGGTLGYGMLSGSTTIDSLGFLSREEVDDNRTFLNATLGLRQSFLGDKLRFIVTGRADVVDLDQSTVFLTGSTTDSTTLTSASYAIGLEGVLSNVVFDFAWLSGTEEPVIPVDLGLPGGSRRSVELDRLIFAAGAAW